MFVGHEPCPSCGSRNNLGRYSDGGAFCFGCHYVERATHFVPKSSVKKEYEKAPILSHDFSPECVSWIMQYGLSLEELLRRGCGWNDQRKQLVFTFPDSECWQARNFGGGRTKYFTQGDVNELIPIYASGHDDGRLAVVEDCISAIKLSRQIDCMPVLGSHISGGKLASLARRYHSLIIWLDSDKYKEAINAGERARLLGINVKVVYTDEDPKCINDVDIKTALDS